MISCTNNSKKNDAENMRSLTFKSPKKNNKTYTDILSLKFEKAYTTRKFTPDQLIRI